MNILVEDGAVVHAISVTSRQASDHPRPRFDVGRSALAIFAMSVQ